jgi:hypothetical protein
MELELRPVEGRVNHIKMVKRQMFGKAGLPLTGALVWPLQKILKLLSPPSPSWPLIVGGQLYCRT